MPSAHLELQTQDLESKLQKLQSQNDALQSSLDTDDDKREFYRQLKLQRAQIDSFIKEIKDLLQILDRQSRGIDGKNKSKRFKEWFQREMDRNKRIFGQLLTRSSFGSSSKVSEEHIDDIRARENTPETGNVIQQIQYARKQDQDSVINSEWDALMLRENQKDLDIIDMQAHTLQKCMADISQEVTRQDQDIDIIVDLGQKTKENVIHAQEELSEANATSKSSRKWYYLLLLVVVVLVIVLILILYFSNDLNL